jgi:hypothetical protein
MVLPKRDILNVSASMRTFWELTPYLHSRACLSAPTAQQGAGTGGFSAAEQYHWIDGLHIYAVVMLQRRWVTRFAYASLRAAYCAKEATEPEWINN